MSTPQHSPMMPLRQWLEHRFLSPVVLLAASAEAEESATKNGLNMMQLLRPLFTSNRTLRARVSERSDTTTIEKMHVRLHYPETVREVDSQTRTAHFVSQFTESAPDEASKGEQLDSIIDILTQEPRIPNDDEQSAPLRLPPAHQQLKPPLSGMSPEALEASFFRFHDSFARDYITMVRCSYFDCLDHPVGMLLVGSTSIDLTKAQSQSPNAMILQQFRELTKRSDHVRDSNITMDDELMSYYVLMHDMSSGPDIKEAQKLFGMLKAAVGEMNCCMVAVNSGGVGAESAVAPQPMRWVVGNAPCDIYATDGSGNKFPRVSFLFNPPTPPVTGIVAGTALEPTTTSDDSDATASSAGAVVAKPLVARGIPTSSTGQLSTGCFLSGRDVDELTHMAENFIANNLLPHMEKKHRLLTASVNDRRKTGLSRVAAWFSSDKSDKKEKDAFVAPKDGQGPTKYIAGSVEMCIRRLADISLALRDYDCAISWYKALLDDLTSNLSSRPFNGCLIAAAHEGIAIATYFQGRLPLPSPTRFHDCRFEMARDEYQRYMIASYSFRSSLIMYLLCRNKPITPANDRALAVLTHRFVAASIGQNRVYGAIVNDIAAHCWLFQTFQDSTNKRGIRKFARLMCMAGSDYRRASLSEHALRCFCRAIKVYRQKVSAKKWTSIYDNLIAELGALYFNSGDLTRSVGLYSSAVSAGSPIFSTSGNAPKNLDNYVSQLIAFMSGQKLSTLPHLLLPNVVFPKYTEHELRYGPDEDTSREEQSLGSGVAGREWSAMEDILRAYYTKSTIFVVPKAKSTTQMIAEKRKKTGSNSKNNAADSDAAAHEAGVGEVIYVPIAFHNPVASDLTLTNVCLLFIENGDANNAKPKMMSGPTVAEVVVPSERKVNTAGLSKDPMTKIQLPFSADKVGRFSIVGAAWTVKGVRGQFLLSTRAKEEGKIETFFNYACENPTAAPECDAYIDVNVHNPEANLSMKIVPPLPEYAREGTVHRCELEITNKSSTAPASELALYFSRASAHWVFLDDFSMAENERKDAPLVLPKHIVVPPNGVVKFKMTIRMMWGVGSDSKAATSLAAATVGKVNPRAPAMIPVIMASGGAAQSVSHLAIMLSYYPHDSNDQQSTSVSKSIKLNTLLRRVNLSPAIAVSSAVIAATERVCDIANAELSRSPSGHISVSGMLSPTSNSNVAAAPDGGALPPRPPLPPAVAVMNKGGDALQSGTATANKLQDATPPNVSPPASLLPFASLALVIVNRASRVDGPVKICRVTCLHDPSYDVAIANAAGPLAGKAMEVSPDPLHFLTCSDQGIVLNASIRRRAASSATHGLDGIESSLATQAQYLKRYLFLAQNRRLCETVLLSEDELMATSGGKQQDEMRRITSASPLGASLRSGALTSPNLNTHNNNNAGAVHIDPNAFGGGIAHQRVTSTMTNRSGTASAHQTAAPAVEMHPIPLPLWYGLTHTYTSSGRALGDVPPAQGADFAFYLDKGGAEKSQQEQEMDEDLMLAAETVADFVPVLSTILGEDGDPSSPTDSLADFGDLQSNGAQSPIGNNPFKRTTLSESQKRKFARVGAFNKAIFGQVPSQFPPICFIVTWSSDVNSTSMYGQTFHFVDVQGQLASFAHLPRDVEIQQQRIGDRLAPTIGLISPSYTSTRSGTMSVGLPTRPGVALSAQNRAPTAATPQQRSPDAIAATAPSPLDDIAQPTRAQLISAFQRSVTPCAFTLLPHNAVQSIVDSVNAFNGNIIDNKQTSTNHPSSTVSSSPENTNGLTADGLVRVPDVKLVCDGFVAKSRKALAEQLKGYPLSVAQASKMLLPLAPRAVVSMRPVYKSAIRMNAKTMFATRTTAAFATSSPQTPAASAVVGGSFSNNKMMAASGNSASRPLMCVASTPVDVVFTNHSSLPLKLTVAMLPASWSRQQHERLPSAHITFEGVTRYRFIILPDESFTCTFVATVTAAGLYNLNNTRFESSQVVRYVEGMRTGAYPDAFIAEATEETCLSKLDVKIVGADLVWPLVVKHPKAAKAPTAASDSSDFGIRTTVSEAFACFSALPSAGASPSTVMFSHEDEEEEDIGIDGLTPVKPIEHCRRGICTEMTRLPVLKQNSNPTFISANVSPAPAKTVAAAPNARPPPAAASIAGPRQSPSTSAQKPVAGINALELDSDHAPSIRRELDDEAAEQQSEEAAAAADELSRNTNASSGAFNRSAHLSASGRVLPRRRNDGGANEDDAQRIPSTFNTEDHYDEFGGASATRANFNPSAAAGTAAVSAPTQGIAIVGTTSPSPQQSSSQPKRHKFGDSDDSDDDENATSELPESPLGNFPIQSASSVLASSPPTATSGRFSGTVGRKFEVSDSDGDEDDRLAKASITNNKNAVARGSTSHTPNPQTQDGTAANETNGCTSDLSSSPQPPNPQPPQHDEDFTQNNDSSEDVYTSALPTTTTTTMSISGAAGRTTSAAGLVTRQRGVSVAELVTRRSYVAGEGLEDDDDDDTTSTDDIVESCRKHAEAKHLAAVGGGDNTSDDDDECDGERDKKNGAPVGQQRAPNVAYLASASGPAALQNSSSTNLPPPPPPLFDARPSATATPAPPPAASSQPASKPTSPPPSKNAFLADESSDDDDTVA